MKGFQTKSECGIKLRGIKLLDEKGKKKKDLAVLFPGLKHQ